MKHLTKKIARTLTLGMMAISGILLGIIQHASATDISSNNATAIMIRITPHTDQGVEISSGDVNTNLGTVNLGASTQTVNPATVTVVGNMTNTELNMSGSITGGWSYDNNQTRTSTAGAANLLNVWATFTSISTASAPSQGDEYFRVGVDTGAKLLSSNNSFASTAVGLNGSSGLGRFENNEGGLGDMDSMNPGNQRHLWLFFRTPPTTSLSAEQSINFVLSTRAGP